MADPGPFKRWRRADMDMPTARRVFLERAGTIPRTLARIIKCYDSAVEQNTAAEVVAFLPFVTRAWDAHFAAVEAADWDEHRRRLATPPSAKTLEQLSRAEFEELQRRRTAFEELVRFVDGCAVCPGCNIRR